MTADDRGWEKIAIIGRAGRFPAASGVDALWRLLAAGRTATTWLSDEELLAAGVSRRVLADPHYVRAANVLPDLECFDAGFFGFSPREAAILDPQHRHFLECAWTALEDAGHVPERFAGRIGVFAGVGQQAYYSQHLLTNPALVEAVGLFLLRHTGNDKDFLTTRLSYLLNLTGPSLAVQTACSTGLVTVHLAAQSLLAMECDLALAGGVTIELPHRVGYRHVPGEILSPDGLCRAFDDDSQGTVFGSGCGIVVLRRLADALADGDDIKAVILGSAVNNDGSSKVGYLAPSVDGQAAAAVEALTLADVPPASIDYVEAHGTGTPIGDPIELAALAQAYGPGGRQFCGIGSVKSNLGHLDTAAGTVSLIKVLEALRHERIPASLHCRTPNRRFDFAAGPFQVVATARPWPRGPRPRRAAVNSLGVGGTNAHLVLEEGPLRPPTPPHSGYVLLPFSARTAASLAALRASWQEFAASGLPPLPDVAHTLWRGRREFAERFVIAARHAADVVAALGDAPSLLRHSGRAGSTPPEVVFLFPGGGAQYPGAGVGMLRQAAFAAAVAQCWPGLAGHAPDDLRTMMFERGFDDQEARAKLLRSSYAIPALFVLEYAYAMWWRSQGIEPQAILAHSVGEYAGAVVAGVLALPDALRLVAVRGRVMDAAPAGAMTAVAAGEATVRALLGDELDLAAVNAPEACIVSGPVAAIEAFEARLRGTPHEGRRLHIDVAAHSRQLDNQLDAFRAAFTGVQFAPPRVPMWSSLRGGPGRDGDFVTADYWVQHLRQTVRFHAAVGSLLARPNQLVLEVGPGQTLRPLVQQAQAAHPVVAVVASARRPHDEVDDDGVAIAALGALWAHGVPIAAERWTQVGRRVSLPTYAFAKERHWIEPGAGTTAGAAEPSPLRLDRRADVASWCEAAAFVEVAAPPPAGDGPSGVWLVFAPAAMVVALRAALQRPGRQLWCVTPGSTVVAGDGGQVRPGEVADHRALLAALPAPPVVVLHAFALANDGPTRSSPLVPFDATYVLLQALLAAGGAAPRVLLATSRAFGDDVVDVDAAAVFGVASVAPREWPGLQVGIVDLETATADSLAQHGGALVAGTGAMPTLLVQRGERYFVPQRQSLAVPRAEATAAATPPRLPRTLRPGGCYVVTGGSGGIGQALGRWLAAQAGAKVALLSRRGSCPPATATAGELFGIAVDVTDRAALAAALQQVRDRCGRIDGVFHAAGTIDDGPLVSKSLAAAHAVLAPKVLGGANLAALLPPGSLDWFVVVSSSSVWLGPAGQTDYVAANAWLEALARSRPDGRSLAFGTWRDIGMAEQAYGLPQTPGAHPWLGQAPREPDGAHVFTRRFDPARDWVLDEHRVGGEPVWPGAACFELVLAAMRTLAPAAPIEVTQVAWTQPLVCRDDLPRWLVLRLRPGDGGYTWSLGSRAGAAAAEVEHAQGRVRVAAATPALPRSLATAAAVAATAPQLGGRPLQGDRVQFGPHWQGVGDVRAEGLVAEGTFTLPAPFHAELETLALHAGLLDMAMTVGLAVFAARGERQLHAPMAVDAVRCYAALPAVVHSRAVLVHEVPGRVAVFDVVLRDAAGALLLVCERLTMRVVTDRDLAAATPAAGEQPRLLDVLLARGIAQDDAPAVFQHVLDATARQLVVSPVPLEQVRLAMASASRPAQRPVAAATATAAAEAPQPGVETTLAGWWSELLGAPVVGRRDDFFALGGHSLTAVRMLARVRQHFGVDVPLAELFAAPTIAALAARLGPGVAAPRDAAASATVAVATAPPAQAATVEEAAKAVPAPTDAWPAASAAGERTLPTTPAQREILAAILIDPEVSLAYNLSFSWHFTGPLAAEPVAAAMAALVARHDSLRATFGADGTTLRVGPRGGFPLEQVDLRALPPHQRDAEAQRRLAADVGTPFDLQRGPLFRATLLQLDDDRHELRFLVHHAVCDGWSVGVLLREFHALWQAAVTKAAPALPAAPGLHEFVAAEAAFQQRPVAAAHRRFWLERFADGAPAMELPTDRARPPVKTTRAARHDDALPPELVTALRGLAKSLGASLANVVFAAFQLYVGRLCGTADVVIGLPASGQRVHGLDGLVGHCVDFLPVRCRWEAGVPFARFVAASRLELARALDHQHYAYGELVRELRLRRDPSRVALVPVIFNIDNLAAVTTLSFPGLRSQFTMNPRAHEHFEWFVNLLDEPERVLLSWQHNVDLFRPATMAAHAARFRQLLAGLAQQPATPVGAIGALFAGPLRPASGDRHDPGAAGPQQITVHFRAVARQHATRLALRYGDATMDYATLDARSDALAAALAARGVAAGDLVGIGSQRGLELVVAVLGALKAGAGYVPFDVSLPDERLRFMAADTRIKVLLGSCAPVTAAGVPTLPYAAFPTTPAAPPEVVVTGESIAYVMYTSGTTGRPKGVVLPHRSVVRMLVDTDWLRLGPDTVTLHSSAFAFDTSIIDLFAALLHGGTVVIPPDGTLSLHQLGEAIASHGVNTLWLTSGLFHAIADLRPEVFAAVGQVIVGGDVVSPVHVQKVTAACPGVQVINGYGPTESNVTNAHAITAADLASGQALPIGRAIPGTQIWILDEAGQPVAPGLPGELCISGRGLALGYHDRPELTAEKFVVAAFDPTLRLYRSGDLAVDPGDGVIRFLGRIDGQVKIRGFRVELGEVETTLQAHPAVRQAVVVAHVPPGQLDKVLGAYLVPHGAGIELRGLRDWLRERLPEFARPLYYRVVPALPLNHNGKVDRRALPPFEAGDAGVGDAAPAGPTESRLVVMWGELLGLPRLGAEANFFELGGHSLLAVRLFDRVQREFGVVLPIATLFQHPTVRSLAAVIDAQRAAPAAAVTADAPWDTSVVMHPGPGTSGRADRRPLFLVGGVGGNLNNLVELAQLVGRRRAVVGFQTRGILGHAPHTSIEAMASDHLAWLRQHQARGPYLIAGYSGGALTAFEMARQLVAADEVVDELFVFDTFAPGFAHDFRPRLRMSPWQRLRAEGELLYTEGIGFFLERMSARLQNTVLRRPLQAWLRWRRPEVFLLRHVEDAWRAAAAVYRGGSYPHRLTLLQTEPRALSSRLAYQQDPTFGWSAFVPPELLVRMRVPGDHLAMVHGANAESLAQLIELRIEAR